MSDTMRDRMARIICPYAFLGLGDFGTFGDKRAAEDGPA